MQYAAQIPGALARREFRAELEHLSSEFCVHVLLHEGRSACFCASVIFSVPPENKHDGVFVSRAASQNDGEQVPK